MIRVGILGGGIMGERVAAAVAAHPGAAVGAVADRDAGRRAALAGAFRCPGFSEWQELIAAGGVDAVYVGLPHQLHAAAAGAAAARGMHILLDKPLCNTLDESDRILGAVGDAGVRLMVGFSHRFRREVAQARDVVRSGDLGRLSFASDVIVEALADTPSWYWDAPAGGGVVQLQMHHSFDRLAWIMGSPIVAVGGRMARQPVRGSAPVDVAAVAALHFGNGVVATSAVSLASEYECDGSADLTVQGAAGHVRVDTGRWVETRTAAGARREDVVDDDWLAAEVGEFVAAVQHDREPSVTGADGRRALMVALALRESAATGSVVEVPE